MAKRILFSVSFFVITFSEFFIAEAADLKPGLAGTYFKGSDFTRPENGIDYLDNVDKDWGRAKGNNWSARWGGYIAGPNGGEVTFTAKAFYGVRVLVDGKVIIDGIEDSNHRVGVLTMEQGKKVPIVVEYACRNGKGRLYLSWQWRGHAPTIVPASALSHDPAGVADTSHEGLTGTGTGLPKIETPPDVPEHECIVEHVVVYDEPGRYAGWPANGGFWMWGDEMAIAFECGWFKDKPDWEDGHARDYSRGNCEDIIARSSDGGLTWSHKLYDILGGDDNLKPCPGNIEFTNANFAMKLQGNRFYYSYDRAVTWEGPFLLAINGLPDGVGEVGARTCYFANGTNDGFLFTGFQPNGAEDLSCCVRTTNGGKTFDLVGWISPDFKKASPVERWMVYSGVKMTESHFIAALRRKINKKSGSVKTLNWIDVYESKDTGKTWNFLSKVADTDVPNSEFNGNPPSMVKLRDGRLCVTYGFRGKPPVICAKLSGDNGKTWSNPVILRTGARNWDIGYSRTLQRADGKVITVYYFATPEHRNQYIEATIWDPSRVSQ